MLLIGMMVFLVGTLTIQLIPSFTACWRAASSRGWAPGQGAP
jgi:DHA1 family 2-module integral membrane pump EmrD-like MFS transporter